MKRDRTGRGPNISHAVRRLIISEAIHDSKDMPRRALAIRLQDLIEKMEGSSPTEDTLTKMISEARNQQAGNNLDQPWSIGASASHDISPGVIPTLIDLQKLIKDNNGTRRLSLREAHLVGRLVPVAERVLQQAFIDRESRLWVLLLIVDVYVQRERVSLQMKEPYPDTADLDTLFFANDDLIGDDSLRAWWDVLPTKYQEATGQLLELYQRRALEEAEEKKGQPLSKEEATIIDQGFEIAKTGGPKAFNDFVEKNELARRYDLSQLDWGTIYSEALQEVLK